ncbi:hypothetical protein [Paenibacillus sp. OAS669]|uniref:hypothetical protein n=1 Tax=Paenibacillus sp. OAS669 TaxID=2663821 RepID=UPI00178AE769|nr:hypothetical protein [Paenibacillus sp. OAS669]MBE1446080.1 hypothetical protein [Paenibacillus sp. OAS669]
MSNKRQNKQKKRQVDNNSEIEDTVSLIMKFYSKDLSIYSLLYKNIKFSFYLFCISVFAYFAGVLSLLYNSASLEKNSSWNWLYFSLVGLFFIAAFNLDWRSKKFVYSNYGNKFDSYRKQLEAEQIKRLKYELLQLNYDSHEKIDDLIEQIETISEQSKVERLLPFSIFILIVLPIWNEYIGFRYNGILRDITDQKVYSDVMILIGSLLIIAIVLIWIPAFIIVKVGRMIYLKKVNKQNNLCNILKRISHNYKRKIPAS